MKSSRSSEAISGGTLLLRCAWLLVNSLKMAFTACWTFLSFRLIYAYERWSEHFLFQMTVTQWFISVSPLIQMSCSHPTGISFVLFNELLFNTLFKQKKKQKKCCAEAPAFIKKVTSSQWRGVNREPMWSNVSTPFRIHPNFSLWRPRRRNIRSMMPTVALLLLK